MKVLHLNAGNETGGGMVHILSLLKELSKEPDHFVLGLFEKHVFYEKSLAAGIHTVVFEQDTRYNFGIIFRVIKYIKHENIDIIHTHGARANLYGYLISKLTKVTWMTTVHSDPRNDFLGRGFIGSVFTKLHLLVLKKPDYFFAVSERFKEMLSGFGIAPDKVKTIYNGIDFKMRVEKQIPRETLKLSKDDFVILMVARFDPVKRHDLAIETVESLITDQPETKLLLVGDGPTKKDIQNLVKQKGLEGHVQFLGYREDVNALFELADISLLTSLTESFPLVLLESAREKTPVITTDVGGVRDMIPDDSYSIVLDDSEVKTIVTALKKLFELKKDNKLKEMGTKLYEFTSKRFSIQSFEQSIYRMYKLSKK